VVTRFGAAALLAAIFATGSVAHAAIDTLGSDEPATVSNTAVRGVAFTPDAECDLDTATTIGQRHPDVDQLILMATASSTATSGTVEVAVRTMSGWRCQRSTMTAMFGRAGTRPLSDRRSGDGTTPAGVFPLGVVEAWDHEMFSMFGNSPDPGVLAPYRDVQPEDCWGATPGTASYGHVVNDEGCPGPDDEWLPRFNQVYAHAAVIGANLDPVSGDQPGEIPYASAIFLHRHSYTTAGVAKPTSGCVSLTYDDLVDTLRIIDPRLNPHFAIGSTTA
jgi:L,D-peptidoglycan transpeptidase YkuD (ErfK/YbiS/YcfS/YnhG family)